MGTLTDIKMGVYTVLDNSGLTVVWPNIAYTGQYPHVEVNVLPASTDSIGLSGIDRFPGIIQIDCHISSGGGDSAATALAEQVISLFKRGTKIQSGTITIEINESGWASSGQQTPDGYFIPVSIPYEVIT